MNQGTEGSVTRKQYSQPSVSAGSTFTDLANPGSQNILGGKKKSRKFKKNQNLNLPHINNRLHGIFIAIAMAVDLEMPYSIQKDVHRLCVNTISFYIRNLSIHRF